MVGSDLGTPEQPASISAAVSRSPNKVDVEFLPKGLHDMATAGMCERFSRRAGLIAQRLESTPPDKIDRLCKIDEFPEAGLERTSLLCQLMTVERHCRLKPQ